MRKTIQTLLICLLTFHLQAQNDKKVPNLSGHIFNNLETMQSPFINTRFDLNMGIANTGIFSSESLQLGDTTLGNLKNQLLYVGLNVNYSQKVKNWASFFLRFDYSARLGTAVQSLVTQGISSIITTETGVKFRVSHSSKHQLAMYYSLTNYQASIVDVAAYVDDLIANEEDPHVTRKVPALVSGAGLTFVHTPAHWVGFHGDLKLAYGETLERGESKWQYFAGASLDFYFGKLINLPLSLIVGGTTNTQVNTFSVQGDVTSNGYIKLSYSGSDSFFLSLSTYTGRTPIEKSDRHVGVQGFQFTTSLFF